MAAGLSPTIISRSIRAGTILAGSSPQHAPSSNADLYGGIALAVAAIAALLVANSPFGPQYSELLGITAEFRIGSIGLAKSLGLWINDGLMAVFFLLVGIEIKREALDGPLASPRQAALPIIAAAGGFIVPGAIFVAVNHANAQALHGWAVASATDIAFVVGICAMLGRAVPASLKVFLLALAIIDDLMAIVVIAVFYTSDLSMLSLLLAALGVAGLAALNACNVRSLSAYVLVGAFTWVCVLKSGIHATLAGVAVGLAIPHRGGGKSLLEQTEHALKPWVSYVIVPVFAFANAGVPLAGLSPASLLAPIPLGIAAGLFFGKQLGVLAFSAGAVGLGAAEYPRGVTPAQFYGAAILTGIGFTMSLFIGILAFGEGSTMVEARIGILLGSLLSGMAGAAVLWISRRDA